MVKKDSHLIANRVRGIVFFLFVSLLVIGVSYLGNKKSINAAKWDTAKENACNELGMTYLVKLDREFCRDGYNAFEALFDCKEFKCDAYILK